MDSSNGAGKTIADTPFEFFTVSYLTKISNLSASTLSEFLRDLEHCSDGSIFFHTFQTLGSHHFLTEGFSNDFAQWVLAGANRDELAEQLATLDIRDYTSIPPLRADLCRAVREYLERYPEFRDQRTLQPFYFCEGIDITLPFELAANTLDEFYDGIKKLSHSSFYFHFISSRLRLHLETNDFSNWLAGSLHLTNLAQQINHIDIYTNTLDSARTKLLQLVDLERKQNHAGPNPNGNPHSAG